MGHCGHISNQTIDSLETVSITFLHPTQPRMSVCLLYLLLLPAATLGRSTDSPGCVDTGCETYYGGDGRCVFVLHGNWSQIGREYDLTTENNETLCRSQRDVTNCCRCFRITSTTTTSPPVCTDVHGSCRAAFNGSGACIDVRQGDLSDIDIDVDPLDGHCSTGPENCCECFKIKTKGSTSTTSSTTMTVTTMTKTSTTSTLEITTATTTT